MQQHHHEPHQEVNPPARLWPSQRAFREDPEGFLQRLDERAATLFENGYRVYATEEQHTFLVTGTDEKGVVEYRVYAPTGLCTCPFCARQKAGEFLSPDGRLIRCKHVRGLAVLVKKTRRWLFESNEVEAACALAVHWLRMLAHLRQRELQAQRAAPAAPIPPVQAHSQTRASGASTSGTAVKA